MNRELVILPDTYARRGAAFVLTVMAVLAVLLLAGGVSGLNAFAALFFIALLGLCGLVSFETHICQEDQRVLRVWCLGGIIPIWSRVYPFADFRGVQKVFLPEAQHDIWQVGFVTDTGKFLMVTYFTSRLLKEPESEAERFRNYLAGLLSVPVLEDDSGA